LLWQIGHILSPRVNRIVGHVFSLAVEQHLQDFVNRWWLVPVFEARESVVHIGRSLVEPVRQARPLEAGGDFVYLALKPPGLLSSPV
jgi:hypothetical protein